MNKKFCLFLVGLFMLLVMETKGFCQSYERKIPFSEMTFDEVLSNTDWKNIKLEEASLGEFSKAISSGIKWANIYLLFIWTGLGILIIIMSSGTDNRRIENIDLNRQGGLSVKF